MARASAKLSKADERELLGELCVAITQLGNLENAVQFIVDLLSRQEITIIAKRLKIAKLLLDGSMYKNIQQEVKASMGTIAKVQTWLDEGGQGFRLIHKKSRHKGNPLARVFRDDPEHYKRRRIKFYDFLPAVILEEIAISANQRQRARLLKIMEALPRKEKMHRELISLFKNQSLSRRKK